MSGIVRSTRALIRIGVLAAAVVAATVSVGGETKPVSASHAEIIFSFSNTEPIPAPVIVLKPAVAEAIYVWAVGVDDPTGVSGFQVEVTFSDPALNIFALQAESDWINATDPPRTAACLPPPEIFSTYLILSCNTFGSSSLGMAPDGLLATIGLTPAPAPGPSSLLNFSGQPSPSNGTYLLSTPEDLSTKYIPLVLRNSLVFLKCGDVTGDGLVDLFNDIVGVINRFGWNTSHPEWDVAYDMDESGTIDLFNDILSVIQQYGHDCDQV